MPAPSRQRILLSSIPLPVNPRMALIIAMFPGAGSVPRSHSSLDLAPVISTMLGLHLYARDFRYVPDGDIVT